MFLFIFFFQYCKGIEALQMCPRNCGYHIIIIIIIIIILLLVLL